jgi:uncharacterized membrane protein
MFTLIPAFKYGWQEMHKKIWVFLLLTLLYSLADISNSYLIKDVIFTEDINVMQFLEILPSNFVLIISITSIALICLSFFVVTFVLAGLRGVQPMAYLHMKIKRFPVYVLAMILKMLAIGIGLLFFIIPGLLLLLAFYFMEYFIIDRDMSLMDAFRESWKITKGFRIGIFFFEVNLFIIGYILAFPQSLWPDTLMTYAIIALINVVWLPISWNAQGWIYQFVSENQIEK